MLLHATTIVFEGCGILLAGASGVGKSDLALRLMEQGASLVADDQTDLFLEENQLMARPPRNLAGLLEVRGVGVLCYPFCPQVSVSYYIELVDDPSQVERMPELQAHVLLGRKVPFYKIVAKAASAPAIIRAIIKGTVAQNV